MARRKATTAVSYPQQARAWPECGVLLLAQASALWPACCYVMDGIMLGKAKPYASAAMWRELAFQLWFILWP